jgi:hypothetical protein
VVSVKGRSTTHDKNNDDTVHEAAHQDLQGLPQTWIYEGKRSIAVTAILVTEVTRGATEREGVDARIYE